MSDKKTSNKGAKWLFGAAGVVIGILLAGVLAISLVKNEQTKAEELTKQITVLNEEKDALDKQLADLEATKETLTTENSDLETQIETIVTEKAALETRIEELTKELEGKSVDNTQITVVYSDGAKTLKTVTVKKGQSVKASDIPNVPAKAGYTGSWSNNGKNVQGDLVIYPVYVPKTYSITYLLGNYTSRTLKEYYENADQSFVLHAINVGYEVMIDLTHTYPISNEGVFDYAGKTYRVDDRTAESSLVYDADDNCVGQLDWGTITLWTPSASFTLDNDNNLVKSEITSFIMPNEGGIIEVGVLHYYLDRYAQTVTLLETGEVMASVVGYEFEQWYYDFKTGQMLDRFNEYAPYTDGTFDGKYFVTQDTTYILDFKNLNVFFLQTDDAVTWVDPADTLPTSYTYGQDVVLDTSKEYVTHPSMYTMFPARYILSSDNYIMDAVDLYKGMLIQNPVGDITIVVVLSRNAN